MTFLKYDSFEDPNCYKGTFVLKNKLNIKDQNILNNFEIEIVYEKSNDLEWLKKFDLTNYRKLHKHFFGEIYSWAGDFRKVSISKNGNLFCKPEFIKQEIENLFLNLKEEDYFSNLDRNEYVSKITEFLSDLNAIHPFREGNGRVQLTFIYFLSKKAGYDMDLNKLNPKLFLSAMIKSFEGDNMLLEKIIKKLIYVKK